ncbi:MAG: hypothetical protein ACP5GS_06860 [Nitrososphaeria archaeon]
MVIINIFILIAALIFQPVGAFIFDKYNTPAVYSVIRLNYFGFIIPLLLSVVLIAAYLMKRGFHVTAKEWLLFIVSFIFGGLIPFITNVGLYKFSTGGSTNIWLWLFAVLWVSYLFMLGKEDAIYLSYPIGFLVGAISDIGAFIKFGPAYSIFGGYGLLDGDFIVPLALSISLLVAWKIEKRQAIRASNTMQ